VKHRNIALKSALLAAAIGWAALASAQATDGTISGEAVEGQTVVLRGDMGITREIKIDRTGRFSVRHLPVGTYEVLRIAPDGSVQSQTAVVLVNRTTKIK
jgi:L-ascorbate metabolism protein UlaG (beta-lactamase superfamily)